MKAKIIANSPPPVIPPSTTVKDAMPQMGNQTGCALGIVEDGKLVGTLSKNNVLQRIVAAGLDPASTTVAEVMTTPAFTGPVDIQTKDALKLMFDHKSCYLPLVDEAGKMVSWLTVCHLFEGHLEELNDQMDTLAKLAGADGPGG
jgi:CBS-domain-containing membrane protein